MAQASGLADHKCVLFFVELPLASIWQWNNENNGKTHSAWWRSANSDPGYFSGPPPRRHNDHTLLRGAWKHWKLLVFVTLSRQVLKFSRTCSRKLPFLQETDGVLQGFVLLLQLLVAFVERLKFLSISAENKWQVTERDKTVNLKVKKKNHCHHHYCI